MAQAAKARPPAQAAGSTGRRKATRGRVATKAKATDPLEEKAEPVASRRALFAGAAAMAASVAATPSAGARAVGDAGSRLVLITGASPGGLGFACAEALAAEYGFEVVMSCRTPEKSAAAAAALLEKRPGLRVRPAEAPLELTDLDSVRAFADAWPSGAANNIDVLMMNAGIMAVPYGTTVQGHEMHFGVNHLGHFALADGLMDRVRVAGESPKVVSVSSAASLLGIDVDDLEWAKRAYQKWPAYGASKAANVLFSDELARREAAIGSPVLSFSCHPGVVNTNLARYILPENLNEQRRTDEERSLRMGKFLGLRTPKEGAENQVDIAANKGVDANGAFFIDTNKPFNTGMKWRTDANAKTLWTASVAALADAGLKVRAA